MCGIGRVSVDNFASDDDDSSREEDLSRPQAPYVTKIVSRGRMLAHFIVEGRKRMDCVEVMRLVMLSVDRSKADPSAAGGRIYEIAQSCISRCGIAIEGVFRYYMRDRFQDMAGFGLTRSESTT